MLNHEMFPDAQDVMQADGFETRNAGKYVSKEQIRSWHRKAPQIRFEDLVGAEAVRARLEKEMEKAAPVKSFLFYGPPGTGKTSVIEAFVHAWMEKESVSFLRLEIAELLDSIVGASEEKVHAAFQEAIDSAPCILFVDDFDVVCVNRDDPGTAPYQKNITEAWIKGYDALKNAGKPVVLIGAAIYLKDIDSAMRERMTLIELPLPDLQARETYFARKLGKIAMDKEITCLQMAEKTEGYSFGNLNRLTEDLIEGLSEGNASRKPDAVETAPVLTGAFFEEILCRMKALMS